MQEVNKLLTSLTLASLLVAMEIYARRRGLTTNGKSVINAETLWTPVSFLEFLLSVSFDFVLGFCFCFLLLFYSGCGGGGEVVF